MNPTGLEGLPRAVADAGSTWSEAVVTPASGNWKKVVGRDKDGDMAMIACQPLSC